MANSISTTTDRFASIELDGPTPETPKAAPVVGKTIIESARAAAANERALVEDITGIKLSSKGSGAAGFTSDGGLVYDEGTKMMDSGVETAIKSRDEWDKLPLAQAASAELSATIGAESRKDYRGIELANLVVNDKGHLTRANGGLRMTRWSYSQMRSKAPAAEDLRGNLNGWLHNSTTTGTFRTRNPETASGTRELFAAVSDKYTIIDGHDLVAMAAKALPSSTRARVEYDPETTRVDADLTLHNPYSLVDDIAVGRLHRMGARFSTDDRGGRRLRGRLYGERIACINCTLIPFSVAGFDHIHTGNIAAIMAEIKAMIAKSESVMGEFANHWEAAHTTRLWDGAATPTAAAEAFTKLVRAGHLDAGKMKEEAFVSRLVSAWNTEPGTSYQAINRAVTKAAHTYEWADEVSEDLEEQAGEMLWQRVRVLNHANLR